MRFDMTAPQIEIYNSIDQIDPREWDSILSQQDAQASHRFIKTCEQSGIENAKYRHMMVRHSGRLLGVASFTLMDVSLELLSPNVVKSAAGQIRKLFPDFLRVRVLFCGLPVSFGSSCIRVAPGTDGGQVFACATDVMESLGKVLGASILCFKEFGPMDSVPMKPLMRAGYFRAASLPYCSLSISWKRFADYLLAMRAGYRRQVVKTLGAREASKLTFRVESEFSQDCNQIYRLYSNVMERAEHKLEHLNQAFIEGLNQNFGNDSRAILIEKEGRLLGAAIVLSTPQVSTFLLTGVDYDADPGLLVYPNLVTEVVADAIRSTSSRLDLGQTSYALKSRLGASLSPRTIFLKHRTPRYHRLLQNFSGFLFQELKVPKRRVFHSESNELDSTQHCDLATVLHLHESNDLGVEIT